MKKEYKYDAFISYRHCELDKYVAENLHKALETYELPRNIKEKLGISGRTIKRVFRDQEELPLSSNLEDPIVEALKDSKFLIVICSPRLKDSLWCKKEIETFKKLRGRKSIFCVLVEGEPSDSFPKDLLYDEIETTDKNGKKITKKELVEPLAADVRGSSKKEVLKRIKEEKLRLIAPMYNLDYDDLKQRHKQRKMKKILYTSVIAAIVFFLFTIYSTAMFLKINCQQKKLKLHQAISLSEKSKDYLKSDSRTNAVKYAYNALTKFKGVDMPYTPEAEYALQESLGVYNAGISYKAMSELKTKGVIDFIKVSEDNKYALTIDESEEFTIWDIDKLKKIKSYSDISVFAANDEQFTFVGLDKAAYISKKGSVVVVSLKDGKKLKEIKKVEYSYKSISSDKNGKYIAINDTPNLYLYSAIDYKKVGSYKINGKNTINNEMRFIDDSSKLVIATVEDTYDITKDVKATMHIFTKDDLSEENTFAIDANYIEDIIENGSNIYILCNKSIDIKYDMHLVSYDYKSDKVEYDKVFTQSWGTKIIKGQNDGANHLAVVHGNVIDVFNMNSGELIRSYSVSKDVIGIYASTTSDVYLAFASDGSANFLNLKEKDNFIYSGLFEFNLSNYNLVIKNNSGYLLVPKFSNRIIYYEQNKNKNLKEVDLKLDYVSDQGIKLNEYDKVKKSFNVKKKNLVTKMMYSSDKKLLFVSYTDKTASIYRVKDKKFLKMIKNVGELSHYFGKDKNNRIYVGDMGNTYILDKKYNVVGHIANMVKLDKKNNLVVITHNNKFYSLPIYNLNSLLQEARKVLK